MASRLRFWAIMCFLLAGCAKEVIIDLPEEPPKLVVVCHFTEGDNFRAKITLSKPVNDKGQVDIVRKDVEATLSVNGQFWDKMVPDTNAVDQISFWESNKNQRAEKGERYSISVRVPGYPPIKSSSEIPSHVKPKSISLNPADIFIFPTAGGLSELRIPLSLELPYLPLEGRFFAFNLTHETDVYETLDPPIIDFTEQGQTNFLADGRTFSLLHDIPEPVVLVNDKFWSDGRKTLELVARIPFDPESERPKRIFVEWRSLSKEFYRYHLSLSRQSNNLPLSDPDAVFNNILGGYGNFSGYAVSVDTIEIPGF
ncbi:MAG TPA: hypothetical protein DCF33_19685 [Saprospirales bacterium]|nr:hypothetical protein [Saprospirales bacterium]